MKNGKFSKKDRRRLLRWNKSFVLLLAVVTLVIGVVGGSLAYLIANTDSVVNTFTPGEVKITVDEKFDGNAKNDVKIRNTGNVDAKIRAMIVVTWQDDDGNVYPDAPAEGTDYSIQWTLEEWSSSENGWYTYDTAVAPGESTGILFTACAPVEGQTPEGYHLVVDVIAEAIQADGNADW